MLDESLIRRKIDDELDNYNDYYEYKTDGICCREEILNLVITRIYSILIIYYKTWVMADIKCALLYRIMVVGKN